ncbi:MAG: CBS domain-containing protein [bacterium]|nr:CBS domain-containing protein [bacterium]
MKVRDLMSSEVTTLGRNDELSLADDVMRLGRIRHMPVIDESGRVVGVVSQRDLFGGALFKAMGFGDRQLRQVLKTLPVKEVMSTGVETVSPDHDARAAAKLMLERKIGCLPVVEDGKLVGILTESDFVAVVANSPRS